VEVEPGITTGDFLEGFLRGTREALHTNGRTSITISIPRVDPFYLGTLIALYARSVTFYAAFVNINAYHQPGVEAGKKAAGEFLKLLAKVESHLKANPGRPVTADAVAGATGTDPETTFHALTHLAANRSGISSQHGATPAEDSFVSS
jgi:glucose-6-phosphate isomerase